MKRYDLIGSFVWVASGVALCLGSFGLELGNLHRPGPGFMPFLSGIFLALAGFALGFSTVSGTLGKGEESKDEKIWTKANWKNFIVPLVILFGYSAVLEKVGFLVSAFVFLFLLFKFTAPKKLLMPIILAFTAVSVSYLLFSVWLKCQLPRGILRFW